MFRNHKFLLKMSPTGEARLATMPNALQARMHEELKQEEPYLAIVPGSLITLCLSEDDVRAWLLDSREIPPEGIEPSSSG